MGAIDKHIVEANVKLLDENSVLKDDKRILNLKIEDKDKVINELLSKIATLEYEVERLENTVNQIDKYVNKMSYEIIVDNPKKDLQKILKKEKNNE